MNSSGTQEASSSILCWRRMASWNSCSCPDMRISRSIASRSLIMARLRPSITGLKVQPSTWEGRQGKGMRAGLVYNRMVLFPLPQLTPSHSPPHPMCLTSASCCICFISCSLSSVLVRFCWLSRFQAGMAWKSPSPHRARARAVISGRKVAPCSSRDLRSACTTAAWGHGENEEG